MCKLGFMFCVTCFYVPLVSLLWNFVAVDGRSQMNLETICNKIKSQQSYLLNEMTGVWYGIEILDHVRSRYTIESCIIIELQDRGNNHVNLIWKEKNLDVTYKFVIEDNKKAIWTSLGNQEVNEKPSGYDYEQFAGNVFVMKASNDNAVLSFCSSTKLFTVVLSKTHTMNNTELDSIHRSLERSQLPPAKDAKRYCKNRGYDLQPRIIIISMMIPVAFIITRK